MSYTPFTFVAGEVPTVTKFNLIPANDASFNNGTGFAAGALGAGGISNFASALTLPTVTQNPYKFSVYRNAALTPASNGVIACDTKEFDTGSNVDIVTNKGRFTAPVAGFYWFASGVHFSSTAVNQNFGITLNKNGSVAKAGSAYVQMFNGATNTVRCYVSAMIQLALNDYVEAAVFSDGTEALNVSTPTNDNYFQGFLISAT